MAPVGNIYEASESRPAFSDKDMSSINMDIRCSPFRKSASSVGGVQRARSNNEVYELLECPVCMNLMYPPIHQVSY